MHRSIYITFGLVILAGLFVRTFFRSSNDCLISDFNNYPKIITNEDSVTFTYKSSCKNNTIMADFGDGKVRKVENKFYHLYEKSGRYLVKLITADSVVKDSLTIIISDAFDNTPPLDIKIEAPEFAKTGQEITFKDITEGSETSEWLFHKADSEVQISGKVVTFKFDSPGKKQVLLTVNNQFRGSHSIIIQSSKPPQQGIDEIDFKKRLQMIANATDHNTKISHYNYLKKYVCSTTNVSISNRNNLLSFYHYCMLELDKTVRIKKVSLVRKNNCIAKINVAH
jgi:hypothetical protein